jgi:hypothetical protein
VRRTWISENIRASVVGRLEHSRTYYFRNGGDEELRLQRRLDERTRSIASRLAFRSSIRVAPAAPGPETLRGSEADGRYMCRNCRDMPYWRRPVAGTDLRRMNEQRHPRREPRADLGSNSRHDRRKRFADGGLQVIDRLRDSVHGRWTRRQLTPRCANALTCLSRFGRCCAASSAPYPCRGYQHGAPLRSPRVSCRPPRPGVRWFPAEEVA